MIGANELKSMEMADILVSVPVQKWSALSFNDADAIIKAGYDAAAAKSKILLTLRGGRRNLEPVSGRTQLPPHHQSSGSHVRSR